MINKIISTRGKYGTAGSVKLASLAINLGVPAPYGEVAAYTLERLAEFVTNRNAHRYEEFHRALLHGHVELSEAEIAEVDYHALLNSCLNDIEDNKTVAYAELAKSIAMGKVREEHRRHFIIAMRDLAFEHLDLLRKFHVISTYRIPVPAGAGAMSLKSELEGMRHGPVLQLAFNALNSKGFTDSEKLSDLGIDFVEACTPREFLQPGAYGYKAWSGYKCQIISLMSNVRTEIALISEIEDQLKRARIEFGSTVLLGGIDGRLKTIRMYYHCAIVLTDGASQIPEDKETILRDIFTKLPALQISAGARPKFQLFGNEVEFRSVPPTDQEWDSLMRVLFHLLARP